MQKSTLSTDAETSIPILPLANSCIENAGAIGFAWGRKGHCPECNYRPKDYCICQKLAQISGRVVVGPLTGAQKLVFVCVQNSNQIGTRDLFASPRYSQNLYRFLQKHQIPNSPNVFNF